MLLWSANDSVAETGDVAESRGKLFLFFVRSNRRSYLMLSYFLKVVINWSICNMD